MTLFSNPAAPHRIGKLALNVAVGGLETGLAIRPDIERIAGSMMPGIIERVCDRLVPADMHIRLDRIDLNLGRIDPHDLAHDMAFALEHSLEDALIEAIYAAQHFPTASIRQIDLGAVHLDVFRTYLRSGIAPLAGREMAFAPSHLLQVLIVEQPTGLMAMLRQLAHQRHVLERLVLHGGAGQLRSLVGLLAPSDAATILALIVHVILAHRIEPMASQVPITGQKLHRLVWIASLEFLLRDAGNQFNRRRFLEHLLRREARATGVSFDALLALLSSATHDLRASTGLRSSLPLVLTDLLAERPAYVQANAVDSPPPKPSGDDDPIGQALAGNYALLVTRVRALAANRGGLEALVETLDPVVFAGLIRALDRANAEVILAVLDDLQVVHQRSDALRVEPAKLVPLWRVITVQFVLVDAGTRFNQRQFLARLIKGEAAALGLDYAALLDVLGTAVARQRARLGAGSSLPAILGELANEVGPRSPGDDSPALAMQDALAAARRGDLAMLAIWLRDHRADPGAIDALLDTIDAAMFVALIDYLDAINTPKILADMAQFQRLAAASPLIDAAPQGIERLMRLIALRLVIAPRSGHSMVAAWRTALFDGFAAAMDLAPSVMRTRIAAAAADFPEAAGNIGEHWQLQRPTLARGDRALVAATGRDLHPEHAAPLSIAASRRAIMLADPVNGASVLADLVTLSRLNVAQPLTPLGRRDFDALLWRLAIRHLSAARFGRFDRARFLRDIQRGIARYRGTSVSSLAATMQQGTAKLSQRHATDAAATIAVITADAGKASADIDQQTEIEHYLRTGASVESGRLLIDLTSRQPAWLAATVRRLARQRPTAVPELIARLLAWLTPAELVACFDPDSAFPGMEGNDRDDLDRWQQLLAPLLSGGAMPVRRARDSTAQHRLDQVEIIRHWLEHGSVPWWAPRSMTPDKIVTLLPGLTSVETDWLMDGFSGEQLHRKLIQALAPMPAAARIRLLEKLIRDRPGTSTMLKDVARAESAALKRSPGPSAPRAEPVGRVPKSIVNPLATTEKLLAWLDGAIIPGKEESAYQRAFSISMDRGDPILMAYLATKHLSATARARWVDRLPAEALGRVVHWLHPSSAGAMTIAAMVLTTAWRRAARFGSPSFDARAIWAILLDLTAGSTRLDFAAMITAALERMSAGDRALAAAVRVEAIAIADQGGQVTMRAALRRLEPPSAPARPQPAANNRPNRPPAPVPPDRPHPDDDGLALGERVYIANAGLVLLSPYLPRLFDKLGLLTADTDGHAKLTGIEAQSRTVHLVQYLVDGRLDAAEPMLVLNKILCGMAIAAPVEPSITASADDLALCDGLLAAAIANWPMIAGSSVDALRETFLQREGRLVQADDKWQLQVQRRSLDVLVDQIPWGFATIFHRWMVKPVIVTW